jgi:alpha-mannosidase
MVYQDAEILYAEVRKDCEELLEEAFKVIFPTSDCISASNSAHPAECTANIYAYNTTPFVRLEVVHIPLVGSTSPLKSVFSRMAEEGQIVWGTNAAGDEGHLLLHGCGSELVSPSILVPECGLASSESWSLQI